MPSKAKFTTKTKQQIVDRDQYCILCWWQGSECHHVYFGIETNYWPNRNESNQWVLVCRDCHNGIHASSRGEGKRQESINYINEL
mgnify:CR=1 FL=1